MIYNFYNRVEADRASHGFTIYHNLIESVNLLNSYANL